MIIVALYVVLLVASVAGLLLRDFRPAFVTLGASLLLLVFVLAHLHLP